MSECFCYRIGDDKASEKEDAHMEIVCIERKDRYVEEEEEITPLPYIEIEKEWWLKKMLRNLIYMKGSYNEMPPTTEEIIAMRGKDIKAVQNAIKIGPNR